MVLVGAAVLPHGTMIFDGDPHSESAACRKRNSTMPTGFIKQCSALYSSCERAADLLAKMNPDVVILVTPHGYPCHLARLVSTWPLLRKEMLCGMTSGEKSS